MGGGDLNTKKTWHPSTLKNQERVWKAEQAAAEEKKKIAELERERAQERDREELNALAKESFSASNENNRLNWMYDKPEKKIQQEDYLLGKAIDKNFDQAGKSEENEIPAVSRRVVGSSMITSAGDVQVDLQRKLREDPLLLVKERERAARAALLNNPVQRRKLTELLRKEQEQKNAHKEERKSKKKTTNLDNLLAAKLSALGGEKGMNIAKLLESDDSSSDSSSEEETKKKKKKKKKRKQKSKKRDGGSDDEPPVKSKKSHKSSKKHNKSEDSEPDRVIKHKKSSSKHEHSKILTSTKRVSKASSDEEDNFRKRSRQDASSHKKRMDDDIPKKYRESSKDRKGSREDSRNEWGNSREDRYKKDYEYRQRRYDDSDRHEKHERKKMGLSVEEKAARLAEMTAAGAEREIQRGNRVREQRAQKEIEPVSRHPSRNEARVLPDSLESRIHSNRHYIQRDHQHMNEHFARR